MLLLFSVFVFSAARNYLYAELDRHLHRDAEAVQQSLQWDGAALWQLQTIKHAEDDPFDTEPHFEIWSYAGVKLYQSSMPSSANTSPVIDLNFSLPESPAKRTYWTVHGASAVVRVGVEPMELAKLNGPPTASHKVLIRVFRSETDVQSRLSALALALGLATLAIVALGGVLCAWLTKRALQPLRNLVVQTEVIGSKPNLPSFTYTPESSGSAEVDALGLSFSQMMLRLEASYTQLDSFAGDCAHELRTPLASLRARGEELLARCTAPKQAETVAEMLEAIDRMTVLINRLLSLARAQINSQSLNLLPLDLMSAARHGSEMMLPVLEECGQPLELVGESQTALADATWVQHIVMDLLHNSSRYAPRSSRVRLRVWQLGFEAILSVEDQGTGLSESVCQRAGIERLGVIHDSTRLPIEAVKHPDSTCLGLMISTRLARLQGGRLTARALGDGWHAVDIRLARDANSNHR